jgi:hypothetical protein
MSTQPCNYTNCECIGCKAYRKEKGIPEPDPNAAYNEKLREIAEELAGIEFPAWAMSKLDTNNSCRTAWNINVEKNMDKARAMVAKMADCYITGYMSNCDEDTQERIDLWMQNATDECIERGLIPAKPEDNA